MNRDFNKRSGASSAKDFEGMVLTGKVRMFKESYGFIAPNDSRVDDVFVHHTEIEPWRKGFKSLEAGQLVKFRLGEGKNGKLQALEVEIYREEVGEEKFPVHQDKKALDDLFKR